MNAIAMSRPKHRHWPVALNASLLLIGSWLFLVVLALQPPREATVVAAIFPPWWTSSAAFAAAAGAGAEIIRPGALPNILILHLPNQDNLVRLRHAGAWFTADPIALGGCLRSRNS